ncbi:MAG: ComEC/Rec2 family competence protein [Nitrospira sp.]
MLIYLIIGFISGIAFSSLVPISFGFFIAFCFLTLAVYFSKFLIEEKYRDKTILVTVTFLGLLLGFGRIMVSDLYQSSHLEKYVDQKISAEGIVVSEPDVREHNTKLTIRVDNILNSTSLPRSELSSTIGEKVLITVPIYPEYHYGDKVSLDLTLAEPKPIESEDGRVFNYSGFLRARGIWYTGSFVKIKLIESGHGAKVKNLLFKIKHTFTNSIKNALPEPESSLLGGLLLGQKQSLGKELLSEFQKTGTSHIVVLSGYNIAIVAESIMQSLKFLPTNISFTAGAFGIILFTILSGGGASAWRASIMVLVALFAKRMNRDYKVGRALGFAVVLMLASNPTLLVFDPSFQLSVLATIGIVFVSPMLSPYFTKVPERFWRFLPLREIVSSTVATQFTVLPFLIYNTGILSLVSLPVNVLILGTIPLTMFLGFVTGAVGLFSVYLSFVPAIFTYALLLYQLTVVHLGASVPFGAVTLPAFSPVFLVPVYLAVFFFLYRIKKINK